MPSPAQTDRAARQGRQDGAAPLASGCWNRNNLLRFCAMTVTDTPTDTPTGTGTGAEDPPAEAVAEMALQVITAERVITGPNGFDAVGVGINQFPAAPVIGGQGATATIGIGVTLTFAPGEGRPDDAVLDLDLLDPAGTPHRIASLPLRPNDGAGRDSQATYRIAANPTIAGLPGVWAATVTVTLPGADAPAQARIPFNVLAFQQPAGQPVSRPVPPASPPAETGGYGLYL